MSQENTHVLWWGQEKAKGELEAVHPAVEVVDLLGQVARDDQRQTALALFTTPPKPRVLKTELFRLGETDLEEVVNEGGDVLKVVHILGELGVEADNTALWLEGVADDGDRPVVPLVHGDEDVVYLLEVEAFDEFQDIKEPGIQQLPLREHLGLGIFGGRVQQGEVVPEDGGEDCHPPGRVIR